MRARIKVQSYDSSIWKPESLDGPERQEAVYLVEKGESVHTVGLEEAYELNIVDIRPGSVDLLRPAARRKEGPSLPQELWL